MSRISKKYQKKETELIIKNDFPPIVGFVEKVTNDGEIAPIITYGRYFLHSELTDTFVQDCKHHISHIMSVWVFPKLLHHFSDRLSKEFYLQNIRIELFGDAQQNTIYFNSEAKINAVCELVKGKSFTKNEILKETDIEKILDLYCDERDPNAACLMFTFFRGEWVGIFDYRYNRKYASDKYQLAQIHLKSALNDYEKSNWKPFYSKLWDGYELLAESILLLHNQLKLKDPHSKISKCLHEFCKSQKLDYDKYFQDIRKIREFVRYGPGHTINIDYEGKVSTYLQKTREFSEYVEGFLKDRFVNVNTTPIHTVDFVNKIPSEYLTDIMNQQKINKAELQRRLSTHWISTHAFECLMKEDFAGFIKEREKTIREEFQRLTSLKRSETSFDIKELLKGEDKNTEYKQTLRYDVRTKQVNHDLEESVMKELACFMNADGGKILIGVDDSGAPTGLEPDYNTFKRQNQGDFLEHLTNITNQKLGKNTNSYIDWSFHQIEGKEICLGVITRAQGPVYVESKNEKKLYVRINNTCQPLDIKDAHEYILKHWS